MLRQNLFQLLAGLLQPEAEQVFPIVGMMLLRLQSNCALWESWSIVDAEGEPPVARWLRLIEYRGNQDLVVSSSLIMAGKLLGPHLWNTAYGVVVTSATLTALGQFDRYRMRAGLPDDANCQSVPSPFCHGEAAVLSVPHPPSRRLGEAAP
jgi:ATP-dependent DNA helicase DinG